MAGNVFLFHFTFSNVEYLFLENNYYLNLQEIMSLLCYSQTISECFHLDYKHLTIHRKYFLSIRREAPLHNFHEYKIIVT